MFPFIMGAKNPSLIPDTLGKLAGVELYGKCKCGLERRFAIAPLARKYGRDVHYSYLGQFLTCATCGHKGITLRIVRWDETPSDEIAHY